MSRIQVPYAFEGGSLHVCHPYDGHRGNGIAVEKSATQEIPPILKPEAQQAAAQRREAFRYRFPRDNRPLGGKFSVAENARRLLRFFYLERRLAQALGAGPWRFPSLR